MADRLILAVDPYHGHADETGGLARFLRPGPLCDPALIAAIRRLQTCHDAWLAHYPLGIWGEGLDVTREMRLLTETFLPMREIRTAFRLLYSFALRFSPLLTACPVHRSSGWLDLLPFFYRYLPTTSPAVLLEQVALNEDLRLRLLFGMFLPPRYGCGFGRYERQLVHVRDWLNDTRHRRNKGIIRCLDAATGTGEGAYDLAQLLLESGYPPERLVVHGSSPDPFELIAGACGRFPHDPSRERRFRNHVRTLALSGVTSRMTFLQGDVLDMPGDGGCYDLVVCNGLLGGPLLHADHELRRAVSVLTGCLSPGGLLCIADRFHDGWRRHNGESSVRVMLRQAGFALCELPDGVAAMRSFGNDM